MRAIAAHFRNAFRQVDYSDTWALRFLEFKILYIPIPKAANSSVRRALLPLVGRGDTEVAKIQAFDGFDKLRFSEAVGSLSDDWFAFTVVRNPYARFVSAYVDKLASSQTVFRAFATMGAKPGETIESFARITERWPRNLLNDHIMPQSMLLSGAVRHRGVNFFRLEEIETSWPQIAATISERSGRSIGSLGRANATHGPHWRTFLTPSVRAFVNRVYREDFHLFGYEMER